MPWMTVGSWLLVAAVAVGAHVFGREARGTPSGRGTLTQEGQRKSVGVAVSITGPLLLLIAGLIVAAVTGQWAVIGLATVVGIVATAAIGLYLAPD